MSNTTLLRTSSDHPDFNQLVHQLNADLSARYGDLQKEYDQYNNVEAIDTAVVLYVDSIPAGCGCFKNYSTDTVEIKRMFVEASFRGKGLSKVILQALEKWAAEKGYKKAVLETADKQPEAIGLYRTLGYEQIDNYGPYVSMPASICFSKALTK
jgi:putative acetyltransferase